MGRHGEALASCDRALGIYDTMHMTHLLRGSLLARMGRSDEALASCDRAAALARYDEDVHLQRGSRLPGWTAATRRLRRTTGQSHWT